MATEISFTGGFAATWLQRQGVDASQFRNGTRHQERTKDTVRRVRYHYRLPRVIKSEIIKTDHPMFTVMTLPSKPGTYDTPLKDIDIRFEERDGTRFVVFNSSVLRLRRGRGHGNRERSIPISDTGEGIQQLTHGVDIHITTDAFVKPQRRKAS